MGDLLSVFGIDWKLLLAQGVNFVILLAGLSYFLYRPVMKMISQRRDIVAKGVKDAEEAARSLKETESKRSVVLSAAEREAEAILARALEEGKNERAGIVKAANERSAALLSDAEAQAAELERKALRESEQKIARMAVLAAEKILKEG